MENEKVEPTQDEVVKAIREEYEKKIADLKQEHLKEVENVKKECEEQHLKVIRALVSGRQDNVVVEEKEVDEELSFYEQSVEETRKILGIKKEN